MTDLMRLGAQVDAYYWSNAGFLELPPLVSGDDLKIEFYDISADGAPNPWPSHCTSSSWRAVVLMPRLVGDSVQILVEGQDMTYISVWRVARILTDDLDTPPGAKTISMVCSGMKSVDSLPSPDTYGRPTVGTRQLVWDEEDPAERFLATGERPTESEPEEKVPDYEPAVRTSEPKEIKVAERKKGRKIAW